MVASEFDNLLQDLSKILNIKDLHLDKNGTCLLKYPSGLKVHIEPFPKRDAVLIFALITEIAPGGFRQSVFKEALKANGSPAPRHGTFAFIKESSTLVLHTLISLKEINAIKVSDHLKALVEKSEFWKTTIESGRVPEADSMRTSMTRGSSLGIFGLRP